jgi:LytTr DNA-binding domain
VSNAPGIGLQIPSFKLLFQNWLIAPYAIALLMLALPSLLRPVSTEVVGDVIAVGLSDSSIGPWHPVDPKALVLPDNHGWMRVVFNLPVAALASNQTNSQAENTPPLGLYLSGTFSARVTWNGHAVGMKGEPAASRDRETPGPIDAVIHLPADVLVPGNNTALIEMSSHYRQSSLNSILHGGDALPGLRLASYSADVRRPIGYYAVPFIVFALLVVAAFVASRVDDDKRILSLLLITALMVAAAAEIFRAFFAYPYAWHMLRLGLLASATLVFACALPFYAARWAGIIHSKLWLPVLVTAGIGATLLIGPPQSVVHGALWLAVPVSIALATKAVRQGVSGSPMLLSALLCLLLSLFLDTGLFFDQYLYVAVIPLLAAICLPRKTPVAVESSEPDRLIVDSAGKQRIIGVKEIMTIQGAGNYAEIKLAGGETVLDDRSLKTLLDLLPRTFVRVHRSHIVNLNEVSELRSLGAGKYELALKSGLRCPLSRAQVQSLRGRLGGGKVAGST